MRRQPIQAHAVSPHKPRRNSIDRGRAGVERRLAYHNASLCARRHRVEIARRWVVVVERVMLMAALATVFVLFAAVLLG